MVVRQRENEESLNQLFRALADGTRRDILARSLTATPSVTELAARYDMSFAAVQKHVAVLERAGLVMTEKVGRVRTCKLGQGGLAAEAEWIEAHRKLFEARFDALDQVILEMKQEEEDGSANA